MPLRVRFWMITLCALLAACQPGLQVPADAPPYPGALDQAVRMIERHDLDAARALLTTLTAAYPQQADAWRLLGGIHQLQLRPDEALVIFERGMTAVPATAPGYPDLALQAALLANDNPALGRAPLPLAARIPAGDPRHQLLAAAMQLRSGDVVQVLGLLNTLLQQQPLPPLLISDIYFLAAQAYRQLGDPMLVNDSLFHAVNFAKSPVLVLRIEQLWKSDK